MRQFFTSGPAFGVKRNDFLKFLSAHGLLVSCDGIADASILHPGSASLGAVCKTNRGFQVLRFRDAYNHQCSVQCSSASDATEDGMHEPGTSFLWIGPSDAEPKILASQAAEHGVLTDDTEGWVPYPVPDAVSMTTRMHLSREQVNELILVLRRWLRTGTLGEVTASEESGAD